MWKILYLQQTVGTKIAIIVISLNTQGFISLRFHFCLTRRRIAQRLCPIPLSRPTEMFAWPRGIDSMGEICLNDVCGMPQMKDEIVYLLADNGSSLNRNS
jgi:hypothetical protein